MINNVELQTQGVIKKLTYAPKWIRTSRASLKC